MIVRKLIDLYFIAEEEMEEERCPTPPREPSPVREPSPTPESPPQPPEFSSGATKPAKAENKVKGKRRKRVQKTKTYTNDEGYIGMIKTSQSSVVIGFDANELFCNSDRQSLGE